MAVSFTDWFGACWGEIRVQPGRYGGGWIGVASILEEEWGEEWSDMIAGDNDYFEARDYFNDHQNFVMFEGCGSGSEAFSLCLRAMKNKHDAICAKQSGSDSLAPLPNGQTGPVRNVIVLHHAREPGSDSAETSDS